MQVVPLPIARVSSQLSSSILLGGLQSNQLDLLRVQTQLSTQQKLNLASDDPAAAMGIEALKREQDANTQYTANLQQAEGFLNSADAALSGPTGLTYLLNQAKSIASSQIGIASTPDERQAQAAVVDSLISQVLNLANTKYRNASVFGGANGTQDAFTATAGGYLYQGSTQSQGILTPTGEAVDYTVDGNAIFGGLSAQVVGYRTLTPSLDPMTRLASLIGATGQAVTPGAIRITAGGTNLSVDLSTAVTADDVVTAINNALTAAGVNASIGYSSDRFTVTNNSGSMLIISDATGSTAASDLGLGVAVPNGTTGLGFALKPQFNTLTPLSALGLDTSGIQITNGSSSATISLAGLGTLEDLLNAINGAGVHVRAEINAAGNGINVFNALSGTELRIGENGGTTADQLGIRSFQPGTLVADLNGGTGITPISTTSSGLTEDLRITRRDGTSFAVDFTGVKTIQDVLDKINTATGNTAPGTQVVASLNSFGNGIHLTDPTAGPGVLTVTALNGSPVAGQLGINKTADAATPDQISGDDVNGLQPQGVFSALMLLRDSLTRNDNAGITRAAAGLDAAYQTVVQAAGTIGARVKDINARQDQASADAVQIKSSLSDLSDVDMTEAITRYQSLQTAYQASLQAAATTQGMNLLDFLK